MGEFNLHGITAPGNRFSFLCFFFLALLLPFSDMSKDFLFFFFKDFLFRFVSCLCYLLS